MKDDLDRFRVSDISKLQYDLNYNLMMEIFVESKFKKNENCDSEKMMKELDECKQELSNRIEKLRNEVFLLENAQKRD